MYFWDFSRNFYEKTSHSEIITICNHFERQFSTMCRVDCDVNDLISNNKMNFRGENDKLFPWFNPEVFNEYDIWETWKLSVFKNTTNLKMCMKMKNLSLKTNFIHFMN